MKSVLQIGALALVLAGSAGTGAAADVPLDGAPAESFGPANLNVIVAGVGLETQPATFTLGLPADATVVAAYLYINGRGVGDENVVLNGSSVFAPLVAQTDLLPGVGCERAETRRIALDGDLSLVHGPNSFTVDGYDQCVPGGAFVVAVVSQPGAPMRTVDIVEGEDYAYHDFAPPFGPNTDVGAVAFAPVTGSRVGHAFLFVHDTLEDRADAIWTLTASSATTPIPASLVGGTGGATLLEIDRLGVPASAGGYGAGNRLDIVSADLPVASGADYFAFQVESPAGGNADSIGLSVAVLVMPTGGVDDGGPGGPNGGTGVCGNGKVEGAEACDDGNLVAGDGCSEACDVEEHAKLKDSIIRVRKHRRERVWYFIQLPGLPSQLVGTAPVHVTLLANGHALLDLEVPVKAWQRVEPRATSAVPGGKFASARGRIGDTRLRYLRLWPMSQRPTYNLKFKVKREMLKRPGGITKMTSIIRVGDQTYTTTDGMIVRRKGKILRNDGN